MSDGMNNDGLFVPKKFENDSIGALSDLIETAQFSFQRKKFGRIEVSSQPFNAIDDPLDDRWVELLQLFYGRFEEADRIQGSQPELFAHCNEVRSSIALGNGFALSNQPFAQTLFEYKTIIRISEEFN
jgi:hypothetical protein